MTSEEARHLLFQSHMATKFCLSSQVPDDEQRKRENVRSLMMSGHVGFESLPDQLVNRSIHQGFCFNILCVGHSLKTLDLLTMKSLDSKVNIIPVIAKADAISKTELQKFKIKLMSELVNNGVQIYQFPTDDDTVAKINASMNGHLPFAVVGSMDEVKVGNKMVKARQYPWGVVQVENENHCDFVKLREMLICTNMEDLREQTHSRHYELYRRCKLEEMGFTDVGPENKPLSLQETYEAKRHEFYGERQRKEEEMKQMFVQRVKEKEAMLKEAERELQAKFEHLKRVHHEERMKLEERRRLLEEEMMSFSKKKATSEIYQNQTFMAVGSNLKKDKDRKNSNFM
ncbi:septin-10 isoform 3-T3 [Rhynchonycteris naso]